MVRVVWVVIRAIPTRDVIQIRAVVSSIVNCQPDSFPCLLLAYWKQSPHPEFRYLFFQGALVIHFPQPAINNCLARAGRKHICNVTPVFSHHRSDPGAAVDGSVHDRLKAGLSRRRCWPGFFFYIVHGLEDKKLDFGYMG